MYYGFKKTRNYYRINWLYHWILVGFWIINYGDSVTDYIQTFTYLPGELGNELANLGWITLIASVVALIASLLIKSAPRGWVLS